MLGLKIYLNGEYVAEEEAKVSVFDHGVLYGDGVFEGIRAYNGKVFRLEEHVDRLYNGAKAIMLFPPISKEEMQEVVLETLRQNNLRDAYIRLVVTRGKGDLGLDPDKCPHPTVFCIASGITMYPEELYINGLDVVTVPTRRNNPEMVNPQMKSLNYLNNILAKLEAKLSGVQEAIMMNNEGYVSEATGDNIFIVKNGVLITPPAFLGILQGITRDTVMELAQKEGITVEEKVFTRYDIYTSDECFLTGTAAEIIPVVKVDGRTIADGKPGAMTQKLIKKYKEFTQSTGTEIY